MESEWTNKYVIKRDLCKAQGKIPGNILYITSAAKPPDQILFQGKIRAPFGSCHSVEFQSGPDTQLIQHMLHMVKETSSYPDNISDSVRVIEIEKPFLVNKNLSSDSNTIVHNINLSKQKRQRNVAIASLLQILSKDDTIISEHGSEVHSSNEKHLKLLKPEDFISKAKSNNVVVSLCDCLCDERSDNNKNNINIKTENVNDNTKTEPKTFGVYKPSFMADFYYRQYLVKSMFKELKRFHYEIKIEKTMEIFNIPELEVVRLPEHRHLLSDDCLVCSVLYKKFVEEAILI